MLCLGCRSSEPPQATPEIARQVGNEHGLVTVEWLKSLLDSQPTSAGDPLGVLEDDSENSSNVTTGAEINRAPRRLVIAEASWAELAAAKDYHRGHIPGAIHINTDLFENGYPEWKLRPIDSLQRTIGELGITPDTLVIVYSEQLIAATRVWWILMYAGVKDVRILDGDARTWTDAGYDLEARTNELRPVAFAASPRADWIIETATIRDGIERTEGAQASDQKIPVRIFDLRSRAEYDGHVSGYSYLDAKGRIPSAIWLGDADDSSQTYKLANGRLRPPREIYAEWQVNGLDLSKESAPNSESLQVFYCGGGWRSSAAFYYAWLSGAKNIRNYSEGWAGWSTRYVRDETAQGNTPGWLQLKTDNPVENSVSKSEQSQK